mmetsp:Transcript_92200/g.144731  ORF Transcript_92200/g.144731 Transcript_92200/m.144731 type:complete len:396 (-) Transcript_92200:47-1234(-)
MEQDALHEQFHSEGAASLSRSSSAPVLTKARQVDSKGVYEVRTGTVRVFGTPNMFGTPLCTLKAGVRFLGTPFEFGSRRTWVKICTEDAPPPMLCLGREAGIGTEHPHIPMAGVPTHSLTLGNEVCGRARLSTASDIQVVDTDKRFRVSGSITSVRFFVGHPQVHPDLRFQVYRNVRDNIFRLIDETPAIACPSVGVVTYDLPSPMYVQRNDFIGWSHKGPGAMPFDQGGNVVRWNNGRQGRNVNINMNRTAERTFSYEVVFENTCLGHSHYKVSAPPPLHSTPDLTLERDLWIQLDEKAIGRRRNKEKSSKSFAQVSVDVSIKPKKGKLSEAELPSPLPPILTSTSTSGLSSPSKTSSTEDWSKMHAGAWMNLRHFGVHHSPPSLNCGRWRQLG